MAINDANFLCLRQHETYTIGERGSSGENGEILQFGEIDSP